MYEISVQTEFCAAHALDIGGTTEPLHGHNWHVTATITGDTLDSDGLLLDFHAVADTLEQIIAPFKNANLNETPPFDTLNPSAEHVAAHIAHRLHDALQSGLAPHTRVTALRVTEATGCAATYRPRRQTATTTPPQPHQESHNP